MKKIILIIILFTTSINAQKIDGICNQRDYFGIPIQQIEYTRYANRLIKERYTSFNEVKNITPEGLIKSMISVKNNKWLSFNYGKSMSWKQEQFDNLNDLNKYVDLLCKLEITIQDQHYAIVKLNLYNGKKTPQFLGLVLKKIGDKWVINTDKTLSNLSFLLMFIAIDDIDNIFLNQKSKNEKLNIIISKSWNKGILDLSRINYEVGELMLKSEYKIKPFVKERKVLKNSMKTIPVIYNYPFVEQKFCYYFSNEISNYNEQELTLILKFIKNKENKTNLNPIHEFSYQKDEKNIFILKYITKNENKVILETEQFIIENNDVKPYISVDNIEKNIFIFIKKLKSKAIIQLTNKNNDKKYIDLNKFKPFIQDFEGIINVNNINEVLTKPALKKYLDN